VYLDRYPVLLTLNGHSIFFQQMNVDQLRVLELHHFSILSVIYSNHPTAEISHRRWFASGNAASALEPSNKNVGHGTFESVLYNFSCVPGGGVPREFQGSLGSIRGRSVALRAQVQPRRAPFE